MLSHPRLVDCSRLLHPRFSSTQSVVLHHSPSRPACPHSPPCCSPRPHWSAVCTCKTLLPPGRIRLVRRVPEDVAVVIGVHLLHGLGRAPMSGCIWPGATFCVGALATSHHWRVIPTTFAVRLWMIFSPSVIRGAGGPTDGVKSCRLRYPLIVALVAPPSPA